MMIMFSPSACVCLYLCSPASIFINPKTTLSNVKTLFVRHFTHRQVTRVTTQVTNATMRLNMLIKVHLWVCWSRITFPWNSPMALNLVLVWPLGGFLVVCSSYPLPALHTFDIALVIFEPFDFINIKRWSLRMQVSQSLCNGWSLKRKLMTCYVCDLNLAACSELNLILFSVAVGCRCGYDQKHSGLSMPPTTGVLGLGTGKASIVSQLSRLGLTRNVVGHCLSSQGGFLFFGNDLVPSSGVMWTPMSRNSWVAPIYPMSFVIEYNV